MDTLPGAGELPISMLGNLVHSQQRVAMQEPLFDLPDASSHPAKYTDALLLTMAKMALGQKRILDPFGGTGKVFVLEYWLPHAEIQAVELEPEWAARNPRVTQGNALYLPWGDGYFDTIITSPTYGNRMADGLIDGSERITYTAKLGRKLHPDNSGGMQWGPKYRTFHEQAWKEAKRVLEPGGLFILNIKDHIRNARRIFVTDWHIKTLGDLGFSLLQHEKISVPSMGYGQNGADRVPYESVISFRLTQ